MQLALIALLVLCAAAAMLYLALQLLGSRAAAYSPRLMDGLPWMHWLTFNEVVGMGHPSLYCKFLLPHYYDRGCLEVRMLDAIPEELRLLVEVQGFEPATVELYEFRLITRFRRTRARKPFMKSLIPEPGLRPQPA